jgi:hypothetical protein
MNADITKLRMENGKNIRINELMQVDSYRAELKQ